MSTTRIITTVLAATAVAGSALALAVPAQAAPAPALTAAAGAKVTGGWSAAVVGRPGATGTLTLVSPDGRQYPVTKLGSAWQVSDVTNDGSRVLVSNATGNAPIFRVVDVRTGAGRAVAGQWFEMRFTNPSGAALLGRTTAGELVRTSLAGSVQARHAGTRGGDGMLPSLDGRLLVSMNGAHRIQVNSNGGARLRTIANPTGTTHCQPQHWTDASHFTAVCLPTGSREDVQVYRYSTAGGAPVALTARLPRTGALQFGYVDSWSTPTGQLVAAASSCGPARAGLVRGRQVQLLKAGSNASPLTVQGTSVWFLNAPGCEEGRSWLTRHDVATGRTVVLAGSTRNRGLSVTSVAVVDRMR
ncbi:hypothetical protein [Luteococcus peritonei]|uniref:Uncharacterized protein n=1 Tax=Luteococcus peritonei TaxID=88874 RepID=A0ABW4RUT1_9ACTN